MIMNKLSAVLIVKNEEANIGRCLQSITFADEIIVLDTGSTDQTVNIAKTLGAKVFHLDKWEGFGKAKHRAVELASNDWILSLDADETISPDLKSEVLEILKDPKFDIYSIKRKSFYLGRIINHSGWDNDYPKRLFDRKKAQFNDKAVHESVVSNGNLGKIENHIFHYTYPTIDSHIKKILFYSDLSSEQKKKANLMLSVLRGALKLIKMYVIQKGFLDGREGFVLAVLSSFGTVIKYFKIWEKSRD